MEKKYLNPNDKINFILIILLFFVSILCQSQGTTCATATGLTINGTCWSGNITDATQDTPNISGCSAGTFRREGWFTFTVTGGPLNLNITGVSTNTNRNLFLQLFSSSSACSGLTQISCANNVNNNSAQTETITTNLSNGIYYLKVYQAGSNNGDINLSSLCINIIPLNNECATATSLTVNPTSSCLVSTSGTTIGATQSIAGCTGTADDDVWYSFTATATMHIVTVTPNTLNDAVLQVYSGSCGSLTSLACIDATLGSAIETTTLTSLTIGTTYFVRVYSFGSSIANRGTFSICISTPPPCVAPLTQANNLVFGSITSTSIPATFSGSADGYLVIRSTSATPPSQPVNGVIYNAGNIGTLGSGLTFIQSNNSTSIPSTGLAGNTRYYYYIYAYTQNTGCSGGPVYNNLGPLSGTAVTCPAVPNSVTINNRSTTGFRINWVAPTGGNALPITYTIEITTDAGYTIPISGSPFTVNAPTALLNISGLTAGTEYYFRIRANNTCSSAWVNGIARTLLINDDCSGAINLPVNLTCTFVSGTNLNATNSSGIPAPGCASYTGSDVWYSVTVPPSGVLTVDMNTGTMTDSGMAFYTGTCGALTLLECDDDDSTNGFMSFITRNNLTPGQTIFIRVWGFGGVTGTFSICATTVSCPTPTQNTPTSITSNSATISWIAPPVIPSGGYQYVVSTSNTTPVGPGVPTTTTSVNVTGLSQLTTYYVFVRSNCGSGDFSTWSPATVFTTLANCPGVPLNVSVTIDTNTSATINWNHSNPIPGVSYQYFLSTSATPPTMATIATGSVSMSVTTLNLTGLIIGQTYYLWVRNNCGGSQGVGVWSSGINFTMPSCGLGSGTGTSALGCPNVSAGGVGLSGAAPIPIDCNNPGSCVTLEATYLELGETTDYTIEQIPYNPPYQFNCLRNPVSVNVDDVWSPIINLPFNFCFYGNNYDQCLIGSNGLITFDLVNNTPGGYSAWPFSSNVPSASLFRNSIFGVFHDIDPSVGGTVGWELITLNTGCRALVASWEDIPMFSSVCNSILYTGMIVLYENTNVIEVYVREKNVCPTWNDGNAIVGIQNATGTQGVAAPNRNGLDANWTVSNEAWRFVPSGAPNNFIEWFVGPTATGPVIGTSNTITVCPTSTTQYTARVTYNLCNGRVVRRTGTTTVTVTGDKTWNGSVDSDWNKPNNWTPVGVPVNTDCVRIPATANQPIISGTAYNGVARNLSIQNGAILTVNPTNAVSLQDWINVNGSGNLILENSASLIQSNNGATNSGNITMRRNTLVRRTDYVYWSSPVASFSSASISPLTSTGLIFKWNPTIANPNGGFGNWQAGNEIMTLGRGYIVRGPNTFSLTTPAIHTANFVGSPNNGIIQPIISRANYTGPNYAGNNGVIITNIDDNWNLIGNPYPSAINALDFLSMNTNLDGSVRLWTHGTPISSSNSNPFYNSYTYNYSTNDYVVYNGTGSTPPGFNGFIGAGQGFFVVMNDGPAANSSVTFNNSLRSHTYNNSQFYRNGNGNSVIESEVEVSYERNRIWLNLTDSNNTAVTTLIGYIEGATYEKDRMFDSPFAINSTFGIYSTIATEKQSIQGRPTPFDENDEVFLGIAVPSAGSYTIAINQVDGLFENNSQNIFLEDLQAGIVHDLRISPYTFVAPQGNTENRFKIKYVDQILSNPSFESSSVSTFIKNETLLIKANENIEKISLYDISGKLIENKTFSEGNQEISSNFSYSNGVYLLVINFENKNTVTRKVIK